MDFGGGFSSAGLGSRNGGGRGGPRPGGGSRQRRGGSSGGGTRSTQPAEAPKPGAEAKPPELLPQMTASVEIVLEDHPDVIILPAQFIKYDEEGKAYCEVVKPEDQDSAKAGGKGAKQGGASVMKQMEAEKKALLALPRERRELTLGFSDGTRTEVVSGLEEGDTVINERPIQKDNF